VSAVWGVAVRKYLQWTASLVKAGAALAESVLSSRNIKHFPTTGAQSGTVPDLQAPVSLLGLQKKVKLRVPSQIAMLQVWRPEAGLIGPATSALYK
jgi:hypothetical protein